MAKDHFADKHGYELMAGYYSPVSDAYKKEGLAPAVDRVKMCQLAVESTSDWLMVDSWESRQSIYQRTAVVLDHFNHELNSAGGGIALRDGGRRDIKIMLLAGGDLIASFGHPGVWAPEDLNHILGLYGCVIIERTGTDVYGFLLSHDILYSHRERINQFAPTAERQFVLGLPTGSSPIGTYNKLVDFCKSGELSFEHVITFNMDEYVGLPKNHPQSYHTFMWSNLFAHLNIKPENVHILDGNAPDLDEECKEFEAKIARVGGIELFLGGIGPDGHIAFNEPGSSLTSRTRVKTLAYETIIANARFFDGDIGKVPKLALTVGVATVMDAREVVVTITGAHKAIALAKCIEEGVNHMWTVSAIQMHPKGLIVCDEDSTLELHVKVKLRVLIGGRMGFQSGEKISDYVG
ncbi:hypothetical protein NQZ79_g4233 [Umbelopsis isabellina]|nr:hypothetical protein NQZ79_g4233 [Umbelopsis isabellina]